MDSILGFVYYIGDGLLTLVWWFVIIHVVLSWLIAFNVVNMSNNFVYQIVGGLDRLLAPIMMPVRRYMPDLGGIDLSPIVVLLIIEGIRSFLWPGLINALAGMV